MNTKHLLAAIAVLTAAGSALAQEDAAPAANFVSTRTRAQVAAEVQQARADGTLDISEDGYPVLRLSGAPKTRAQVEAEVAQARANGTLDISESDYPVIAPAATKTRAQVRAELAQYRRAHPYGDAYTTYQDNISG